MCSRIINVCESDYSMYVKQNNNVCEVEYLIFVKQNNNVREAEYSMFVKHDNECLWSRILNVYESE